MSKQKEKKAKNSITVKALVISLLIYFIIGLVIQSFTYHRYQNLLMKFNNNATQLKGPYSGLGATMQIIFWPLFLFSGPL